MDLSRPDSVASARVEGLVDALLARDGAGGSWLAGLLGAAPRGAQRLGELARAPGWLQATVAVRTETGRRGAFEQPAAPSPRLLGWYIDHPNQLTRPAGPAPTAEAGRLRATLLRDEPPGARARAQQRAHRLLAAGIPLGPVWWRFEEARRCDCVLITDRLVVLVRDGDDVAPATPWFAQRSGRVRDLEAARRIAEGGTDGAESARAWGVLTLTDTPVDDVPALVREVAVGAPHLPAGERAALLDGDLGELGFAAAVAATA